MFNIVPIIVTSSKHYLKSFMFIATLQLLIATVHISFIIFVVAIYLPYSVATYTVKVPYPF